MEVLTVTSTGRLLRLWKTISRCVHGPGPEFFSISFYTSSFTFSILGSTTGYGYFIVPPVNFTLVLC